MSREQLTIKFGKHREWKKSLLTISSNSSLSCWSCILRSQSWYLTHSGSDWSVDRDIVAEKVVESDVTCCRIQFEVRNHCILSNLYRSGIGR